MKNRTKEILKFFIIWLLIFIIIMSVFLILKKITKEVIINKVIKTYTTDIDIQIDKNEKETKDITMQINGNTVIGVLKIDKINFEGLVYEGTNQKILNKGVGHFEESPILLGNVCLAAHNYVGYWANLHTLKKGDTISYISYLGNKDYEVFNIREIDETDWSLLKNTDDNIITLITCIKNKEEKRLCVQAKEK